MIHTYKHIWPINFPGHMGIFVELLINITDAIPRTCGGSGTGVSALTGTSADSLRADIPPAGYHYL